MNSQKTARKLISDDEIEKQVREKVLSRKLKPSKLPAKDRRILKEINSELRDIRKIYEEKAIEREIIRGICDKINEKNISKCMKCKIKQIAEKRVHKKRS